MVDYLLRHPSPYEESIFKSEQLFNIWFTNNVVNEIENATSGTIVSKCERRFKFEKPTCSQSEDENSVLTVVQEINIRESPKACKTPANQKLVKTLFTSITKKIGFFKK